MVEYNRFRWFVEGTIAGAPHPDLDGGLEVLTGFLRTQGIATIVTVCEEPLHPPPEASGFRSLFVETPNYRPPSGLSELIDQIDAEVAANRPVLVHCFAGIGRTGTVLAAWLLRREPALSVDDAIERVRNEYIPSYARNRFPEHPSQESALISFSQSLRASSTG